MLFEVDNYPLYPGVKPYLLYIDMQHTP